MTPTEAVALAARLRLGARRFYNAPWLMTEAAEALEWFADAAAERVRPTRLDASLRPKLTSTPDWS